MDLYLTESGDISFEEHTVNENADMFCYEFFIAPSETFTLNFNIIEAEQSTSHANQLALNFYTCTPSYNKKSRIVTDEDYIKQAIIIRLSTELGTIKGNEKIGCNLHTVLHSNLDNKKLITEITNIVKNAIKDILPQCDISVSILNTDYLDYHDSIKIVIKNNEKLYYYYL